MSGSTLSGSTQSGPTTRPPRVPAAQTERPGLLAEMIRLWLAHGERMLEMRAGHL